MGLVKHVRLSEIPNGEITIASANITEALKFLRNTELPEGKSSM